MTILRKLNKCKQTQGSHKQTFDATGVSHNSIEAMKRKCSRHSQSSFFVKRLFQNHGGFITALNRKRQYLITTLIIIIVIIEHLFI